MWCDEYGVDKSKFKVVDDYLVEGFEINEQKKVFISSRELFLNKLTSGRYFTKYKRSVFI